MASTTKRIVVPEPMPTYSAPGVKCSSTARSAARCLAASTWSVMVGVVLAGAVADVDALLSCERWSTMLLV